VLTRVVVEAGQPAATAAAFARFCSVATFVEEIVVVVVEVVVVAAVVEVVVVEEPPAKSRVPVPRTRIATMPIITRRRVLWRRLADFCIRSIFSRRAAF
jgi:hypothetical protein